MESTHSVRKLVYSNRPPAAILKYLFLALAAVQSARYFMHVKDVLALPAAYHSDLFQEYLAAQALVHGGDPYAPLDELALTFVGPIEGFALNHPTPHPPPVLVMAAAFGSLPFQYMRIAWFVVELSLIVMSMYLLLCAYRHSHPSSTAALAGLLLVGWSAVGLELDQGQLMVPMLALLTGAWLAFRSGHGVPGGVLLGCAVALKLIPWPLIIFLAMRRTWSGVLWAGGVVVAANAVSAVVMGTDRVADYYLRVGREVQGLYQAESGNFSAWSIGWRVFRSTGSPRDFGLQAPPVLDSPIAAQFFSYALPLVLVVVGLLLATRARGLDVGFGIVLSVSIIVSPIAWYQYLVLLLIPLATAVHRLAYLGWPRTETYLAMAVGLVLVTPASLLHYIPLILAGQQFAVVNVPPIPFPYTVVGLAPLFAILVLMGLLWRLRHPDVSSI